MISIPLVPEFLHDIRGRLRAALPTAKSSHIAEACAAAVGFQTHAGLLSAMQAAQSTAVVNVTDAVFRERLRRLDGSEAAKGTCTAAAFETLLVEVIRLARLRNAAEEAKDRERRRRGLPSGLTGQELADAVMERFQPGYKPPELHQLLNSLPHETLIRVEAVMYVGSEGGGFASTLKYLRELNNDPADLPRHIAAKSPLDDYLTRALGFARLVGVAVMWESVERCDRRGRIERIQRDGDDDDLQDERSYLDDDDVA